MVGAQLASIHAFQDNQALIQNLSTKAQPYQDGHFLWIGLSQAGCYYNCENVMFTVVELFYIRPIYINLDPTLVLTNYL